MTLQTAVENLVKQQTTPRMVWLDNAKAYGIILVFYGHLCEVLYLNQLPALFAQFKFIYAFHMPLFFILAGFVARERQEAFKPFLKHRLAARMVPFLFFNLLALSCLMLIHLGQGTFKPLLYAQGGALMLQGLPAFNMLTWFLTCLFTVEMIDFGMKRFLVSRRRLVVALVGFWLVGLVATRYVTLVSPVLIPKNFWYVHEALVAYGFYLLGRLLRQTAVWQQPRGWLAAGLAGLFCLITWFLYDLNSGPFVTGSDVVLLVLSSHGQWGLFLVTAVSGAFLVIYLAKITPSFPPLLYFGQNTLILLGLNGLFFEFFNKRIVWYVGSKWGAFLPSITVQALLVTIFSLLVCIPFIHFFNKYIPQLVGKPRLQGPWLPQLIGRHR